MTVGFMGITSSFITGALTIACWAALMAWLEDAPLSRFSRLRNRMRGVSTPRVLVSVLTLSAAGLVGLVVYEGYTDKAVIPTQGDRPTVGFGTTFHEDGTPVKMGDTTTPVRALIKAQAHISKDEKVFRDSLPDVALSQGEYDLYVRWMYQFGQSAWMNSPMRRKLRAGNYLGACNGLLDYRKITSNKQESPAWTVRSRDANGRPSRWEFDCSTPGNKICRGVWTRAQELHKQCVELQQ